jgi:hypothetical protein
MNKTFFKKIGKFASIIAGMAGYRIDHLLTKRKTEYFPLMVIWGAGIIASGVFAYFIADDFHLSGALIYFTAAWFFYYIGNTLILTTPLRKNLISRFGEKKAYRIYEVIVGLMFANQALAFGAVVEENWIRWPGFAKLGIIDEAGLMLIAAGFLIKTWATMIVGLDIYYYKDMFLGKTAGVFAVTGPYKLFSNPMYGLGNIQAYGLALVHFSLAGLAAAAILHLSIYAFYFFAERPAVRRLHGNAAALD